MSAFRAVLRPVLRVLCGEHGFTLLTIAALTLVLAIAWIVAGRIDGRWCVRGEDHLPAPGVLHPCPRTGYKLEIRDHVAMCVCQPEPAGRRP